MITKKTEYAIRALWELSTHPEGQSTANEIAQRQAIPPKYLPQIIAELVRAGLVITARGFGGGLRLARPASEISLLDVIEGIQGKFTMFECQMGTMECIHLPDCDLKDAYCEAQTAVERVFTNKRLSDIRLSSPQRGPHAD